MNSKILNVTIFVTGFGLGAVVSWKYTKKRFEEILQTEINSVKETFVNRAEKSNKYPTDIREKADNAKMKPDINEYVSKISSLRYSDISNKNVHIYKEELMITKPYVISPEDFAEMDEYEKISLTYYADFVLVDDNDDPIEDVEDLVGYEALNSFGEYEDDSVFVRDDRVHCDYEILLDHRNYADVLRKKPHEVDM